MSRTAPGLIPAEPRVWEFTPPQTGPNHVPLPVGVFVTSIRLRRFYGELLGWGLHTEWAVDAYGVRHSRREVLARLPLNLMGAVPGTHYVVLDVRDVRERYEVMFGIAFPGGVNA